MRKLMLESFAPLEFHFFTPDENDKWHNQPEQKEATIHNMEPLTRLNQYTKVDGISVLNGKEPFSKELCEKLGDYNLWLDKYDHGFPYFRERMGKEEYRKFFNIFGQQLFENTQTDLEEFYWLPFVAIYDTEEERYLFREDEEKLERFW